MANQIAAHDVTFAGKAGQLKAYVAHQGGGGPRPASRSTSSSRLTASSS